MDEYRTRRSPAGERFLGMFSSPSTPSSSPTEPSFVAGDELHEDDFLFSDAAAAQPVPVSPGRGAPSPGHLGLLAALTLHESDRRLLVRGGHAGASASAAANAASAGSTLLRRKATIAAAAASAASVSPAQSPSPTSSARAIPATTARPKDTRPAPAFHQSAPVKVPVRPPRKPDMGRWDEFDDDEDEFRSGDAAMLPPHEMVARASAAAGGAGPNAPFSMLEGAGRTLKGRDLRRVRDAVLRQTGFLD